MGPGPVWVGRGVPGGTPRPCLRRGMWAGGLLGSAGPTHKQPEWNPPMLTTSSPLRWKAGLACLLTLLALGGRPAAGAAASVTLAPADRALVAGGILLDLSPDLAGTAHYDGLREVAPATPAVLRQLLFQLNRATVDGAVRSEPARLRELAREARAQAVVPLALLDMETRRVRDGAVAQGLTRLEGQELRILDPAALEGGRVFAAAALVERTGNGRAVTFQLPGGETWIGNRGIPLARLEVDFADGAGFVSRRPGERVVVGYAEAGAKTLRLRATWADGDTRETRLAFTVDRLETPTPDETWPLVSAHSYQEWACCGASGARARTSSTCRPSI